MQEQLPRLSLSQWTLPSRAAVTSFTSSYPSAAAVATPATWAVFAWTGTPKGRAADAADTESFSYSRTTKALLCLSVSHEVQLLPPPSPFSGTWLAAWHPSPPVQSLILAQLLFGPSLSSPKMGPTKITICLPLNFSYVVQIASLLMWA